MNNDDSNSNSNSDASKMDDIDAIESTAVETAQLTHRDCITPVNHSSTCDHTTKHDINHSAEFDSNDTKSGSDDNHNIERALNQHEHNHIMKGDDQAPLVATTPTPTELTSSASTATTTTTMSIMTTSTTTTSTIHNLDDEKDIRDFLTPEALVRAASESYQEKSLLNSDEPRTIQPRVHNILDKHDEYEHDEYEEEEEDTDKLLASIPPDLTRTTGNPSSAASSQPGAYHHYNTISVAAPESPPENRNGNGDAGGDHYPMIVGTNRRAPPDSESFLIEATLVTEESNHPESRSSPVESAVPSTPMVVAPIYNAEIVQDMELQQKESQATRNQDRGNVVIAKWKLRCIFATVMLLLIIVCIVSITVPIVSRNDSNGNIDNYGNNDKDDTENDGNMAFIWERMLYEQKQKLLSQNSDNYQLITHHTAVVTFHNKVLDESMITAPSEICSPYYDREYDNFTHDENHSRYRYLRKGGPSSSDIFRRDHRQSQRRRRHRMMSEDVDMDPGVHDGFVVTLTCGIPTSSDDGDEDTTTTTPSIILLHNSEIYDSLLYTILNINREGENITYVGMPLCLNKLLPPRMQHAVNLTNDRPEDYFEDNDVDPMIYSTHQCVIYPGSPWYVNEQFVFIYTCASGSNINGGTNVTAIQVGDAATDCSSPANSTKDDSPPIKTSISMSMQRLCRNESTDGSTVIPFQQDAVANGSDAITPSSSSSSSSSSCRADDDSILDPSVTANGTNYYYEYCTTSSGIKPVDKGAKELVGSNVQGYCGLTDDDALSLADDSLFQFCDDLRNSSTYDYFVYLIPRMAMIDNIRQPNIQTSTQCSFDALNSSFISVAPSEGNSWMTLFGFPPYNINDNSTGIVPSKDSRKLAINLRNILLDVLEQLNELEL